jgi:hypothetical protein
MCLLPQTCSRVFERLFTRLAQAKPRAPAAADLFNKVQPFGEGYDEEELRRQAEDADAIAAGAAAGEPLLKRYVETKARQARANLVHAQHW